MDNTQLADLGTIINEGGSVLPFPPGAESEAEYHEETNSKKRQSQEKVQAMAPYFRIWFKKMVAPHVAFAHRYGNAYKQEISIKWIDQMLCSSKATSDHFAKVIEKETGKAAPAWPMDTTDWDIMRAFMLVIRRYNYGMKMGNTGYMILCDSDHRVSQSVVTGDSVWTAPTKLTFTLWEVKNNDYENPWILEWVEHPDDPTQRIQIKKYVKTALVLKPWEKKTVSPETRLGKCLALKEGEQLTLRFNTSEHESEAEEEIDSFLGLLSSASIDSNVRFYTMQPDPFRLIVANQGKLYK